MIKFSKDKVLLLHKLIAQETGGTPILWLQRGHFCAIAGLTQTVTQTRKKAGGYRRTQRIARRAESMQKRRNALVANAFRRSSYLHTQEVTGSSPAVSTKSHLI